MMGVAVIAAHLVVMQMLLVLSQGVRSKPPLDAMMWHCSSSAAA
jgi:hypothetical protein